MPSTLLHLPCEAPGAGQALCSLPQKCSRTHGGLVHLQSGQPPPLCSHRGARAQGPELVGLPGTPQVALGALSVRLGLGRGLPPPIFSRSSFPLILTCV